MDEKRRLAQVEPNILLLEDSSTCVFILSPVKEGSTLLRDHRGSIFSNRAETSQEG